MKRSTEPHNQCIYSNASRIIERNRARWDRPHATGLLLPTVWHHETMLRYAQCSRYQSIQRILRNEIVSFADLFAVKPDAPPYRLVPLPLQNKATAGLNNEGMSSSSAHAVPSPAMTVFDSRNFFEIEHVFQSVSPLECMKPPHPNRFSLAISCCRLSWKTVIFVCEHH